MTRSIIYISVFVLYFCTSVTARRREFCPTNEIFTNCTQLVCRAQNCSQNNVDVPCGPVVEDDCVPGCVCISGTLRNNDGVCVPQDQCEDICKANEDFTECVETVCRAQDCSQVGQALACPRVELCDCTSGCVCSEGFVRDDDGKCISDTQCPAPACPPNEVSSSCIQAICAPLTCSQFNKPIACPAREEEFCITGCVCKPGFLRNDSTGICVPEDSCFGLDCNDNEVVNTCPRNCSDFCPTSEDDTECQITGLDPDVCGSPVCRCRFNFKRDNDNGTCIPTRDCPPFDCTARPNEVYDPCPPLCSDNCSQVTPTGECRIIGRIGIVLECEPKCRCMTGFGRDNNGLCVPLDICPREPSTECSENEELSTCIQTLCGGDNCSQMGQQINCPIVLNDACESGCVCKAGFLRNGSGNCIPQDQCPNKKSSGDTPSDCGGNEEFSSCIQTLCRGENCSQLGGQINCPLDPVEPCQAGCVCIAGNLRDDNGNCIPEDRCPNSGSQCGINEIFNDCANGCDNDACPTSSGEDSSEECIAPAVCLQRCQCAPNFKRDLNGMCILQDQCPDLCGTNEQFNNCPSVCVDDSCPVNFNDDDQNVPCTKNCGPPRCECIDNFRRDDSGNCIPIQNCPQICPNNEEFSTCPQAFCRIQNCDQLGQNIACAADLPCQGSCVCVPGTLRADNGSCISEDQCPNVGQPLQCLPGEIRSCVAQCPPERTCQNRDIQFNCLQEANKRCQIKCICKSGFVRNAIGICISPDQCDLCGENEFFDCGQECDNVCADQSQNRTNCDIINIRCNDKCYCLDGFARDASGKCVPLDQCPQKETKCADPNEEFKTCKTLCPPDSCFSLVARFKCEAKPPCVSGCNCKPGFLRINETSPCIPLESCPELGD